MAKPYWISVSPDFGTGGASVNVTANAAINDSARSGEITVRTNSGLVKTVQLSQEGLPTVTTIYNITVKNQRSTSISSAGTLYLFVYLNNKGIQLMSEIKSESLSSGGSLTLLGSSETYLTIPTYNAWAITRAASSTYPMNVSLTLNTQRLQATGIKQGTKTSVSSRSLSQSLTLAGTVTYVN